MAIKIRWVPFDGGRVAVSEQATYLADHCRGLSYRICIDPHNLRLRVDDFSGPVGKLAELVVSLAKEKGFSKVFVKAGEENWQEFLNFGFVHEGIYRGYFSGRDAYAVSYYLDDERRSSGGWRAEDEILGRVLMLPEKVGVPAGFDDLLCMAPEKDDLSELAAFYGQHFKIYPSPIQDPAYLAASVEAGTRFLLLKDRRTGRLVSAASAEVNQEFLNAEMTDCATLAEYQGRGLSRFLVAKLEAALIADGYQAVYSLARAAIFGMNALLKQLSYEYTGRLANNCRIGGGFEDMNLWAKRLPLPHKGLRP